MDLLVVVLASKRGEDYEKKRYVDYMFTNHNIFIDCFTVYSSKLVK